MARVAALACQVLLAAALCSAAFAPPVDDALSRAIADDWSLPPSSTQSPIDGDALGEDSPSLRGGGQQQAAASEGGVPARVAGEFAAFDHAASGFLSAAQAVASIAAAEVKPAAEMRLAAAQVGLRARSSTAASAEATASICAGYSENTSSKGLTNGGPSFCVKTKGGAQAWCVASFQNGRTAGPPPPVSEHQLI
jgi:hypothetical protein